MSTLKWKIRNLGNLILLALTLVFGEFLISHFVMDIKEKQVFILFFLFSKMARNNQCFLASHMVFHTPIYTLSTRPAPPYVASPPTGVSCHLSSMSPSHTQPLPKLMQLLFCRVLIASTPATPPYVATSPTGASYNISSKCTFPNCCGFTCRFYIYFFYFINDEKPLFDILSPLRKSRHLF